MNFKMISKYFNQKFKQNLPKNIFIMENVKKNILTYEYKKFQINTSIQLTKKEEEIFSIIKKVVEKYKTNTVCRVAGGWVRDKVISYINQLIGKSSDDIDISLDNLTGEQFATYLNTELYGEEIKYGLIKPNPDQSKHLATARIKISEIWVDLVNLRSEKYTDDSRIPEIVFDILIIGNGYTKGRCFKKRFND